MSRDFWSRRRAAVAQEAQAEQTAAQEAQVAERSDEELLQEAGLPDPDALTSPEQVQDFLKSALPNRLKTRALRKLWGMNPVLPFYHFLTLATRLPTRHKLFKKLSVFFKSERLLLNLMAKCKPM